MDVRFNSCVNIYVCACKLIRTFCMVSRYVLFDLSLCRLRRTSAIIMLTLYNRKCWGI